jgi:hypothetical protein
MLKAGVPRIAVELKMRAEGFDPALLCQNADTKKPTIDETRIKKFQVNLNHFLKNDFMFLTALLLFR